MARKRHKVTVLLGGQPRRALTDFRQWMPDYRRDRTKSTHWIQATEGLFMFNLGATPASQRGSRWQARHPSDEGTLWCRGWRGKRVRALLAANALAK